MSFTPLIILKIFWVIPPPWHEVFWASLSISHTFWRGSSRGNHLGFSCPQKKLKKGTKIKFWISSQGKFYKGTKVYFYCFFQIFFRKNRTSNPIGFEPHWNFEILPIGSLFLDQRSEAYFGTRTGLNTFQALSGQKI
jgi:hypothetical protein